jgi:hypothetical protein
MKSLHSLLFFLPDELSDTTIYNIVIGILCIFLAFSLVALYRRIKHGASLSFLEGMTASPTPSVPANPDLYPDVAKIQSQAAALQTTYDKLKDAADDQKNRINANSQILMKTMSDVPNQTNNLTHANLNTDDPSKTSIPSIDMS